MNMNKFLKVALRTGLILLDQSDAAAKRVRERVSDQVDDVRGVAHDAYEAAVAGEESMAYRNRAIWDALRFTAGLGIGVGVALLFAPAKGEDTRSKLAKKAREFGGAAWHPYRSHDLQATGTGD